MSEVKLKPCPFCGGEAELRHYEYFNKDFSSVYKFYVQCKDCEVQSMPTANVERATSAWNTRKPMEDIVERLKDAKEDFREYRDGKLVYEITASVSGINKAIEIVKGGVED